MNFDEFTPESEAQINMRRRNTDIVNDVARLCARFPQVHINKVYEHVGRKYYMTGRRVYQLWQEYQRQLKEKEQQQQN